MLMTPSHVHNIAANAACISRWLWGGDGPDVHKMATSGGYMAHFDLVIEAATALADREATGEIRWGVAAADWDECCESLAWGLARGESAENAVSRVVENAMLPDRIS